MAQLNYDDVVFGFPSFRVFVFGQEVTNDVSDVSVNWKVGRAPSSCAITLLNPNDRYIMRREDIVALNPQTSARFANKAQSDIAHDYLRMTSGVVVDSVNDGQSHKAKIVKLKQHPTYRINVKTTDAFSGQTTATKNVSFYPFIEGKSCFHQNDPVRVFAQDPFDPAVWYYFFSGFITQIGDSSSGPAVEKTLILQCEDVTKSLRYARYTINPGIRDLNDVNIDQDLADFTGFTSPLVGLSLQEAADYIVFGDVAKETSSLSDDSVAKFPVVSRNSDGKLIAFNRIIAKTAAGNFKYRSQKERVYVLSGGSGTRTAISLKDWQNLILDHKVKIGDLIDLRARSDNPEQASDVVARIESQASTTVTGLDPPAPTTYVVKSGDTLGEIATSFGTTISALTALNPNITNPNVIYPNQVITISQPKTTVISNPKKLTELIISEIGRDPGNYPVDGGTLFMLLPEGLDELGNQIIAQDYVSTASFVSEFKDRRTLMYDLVDRVEFVFYADPKGNMIIEFPLFDFDPNDFGSRNSQKSGAIEGFPPGLVKFTTANSDGTIEFDNERRFTIEDVAVDTFSATDDDGPVRTVALAVPVPIRYVQAATENGIQTAPIKPVSVRLDTLIPIYGMRVIQADSKARLVETELGARIAAAVELNKVNSDAYSIKINMLPRFSAWLNRPMLFRHRNHIGTAVSVSHRISWASSAETSISLNYLRGWQGEIDSESGNFVYTTIGGAESRPLNYATLFAKRKSGNALAPTSASAQGTKKR
jgi:LysM repeat protein